MRLIQLRTKVGKWPIRGHELIDVCELIEEYGTTNVEDCGAFAFIIICTFVKTFQV